MLTWQEPKSDYTMSSQVTPAIFNNLGENEKFLNETKITISEVQMATVASSENPSRINLTERDTVAGAFGKIRKWFTDLKAMAFKDNVNDADIISVSVSKVIGLGELALKDTVGNNEITDVSGIKVYGTVPRATADGSGNNILTTYLTKVNPAMTGKMNIGDVNTKLAKDSISPAGNNIGVTGAMLTHYASDEGGLLINEDGAYLWNSTDSGSALKIIDEDNWGGAALKKDATFANGLLFNFDSEGNLKVKGNVYKNNGNDLLMSATASSISITKNSNLGNATTLQQALDYIARVFGGYEVINGIQSKSFNAQN